jgi:hypothetical protein
MGKRSQKHTLIWYRVRNTEKVKNEKLTWQYLEYGEKH